MINDSARLTRLRAAAFLLAPLLPIFGGEAQRAPSAPLTRPAPALIVFITVDQLLPAYFDRYGSQLSGGFARLTREGAVFTNAYQDHAITETAPGHASMLSGRFPYSTGIVMNSAGVQDPQAPLIEAPGPGASPYRFRGSTLTDWLRTKDARTRALSVSRKDRGAILPLGRAKQDVYWYATNGRFTTSTYYRDTLPDWVNRFNARRRVASFAGQSWTPLLSAENYKETDSVTVESGGHDFVFPHELPRDTTAAALAFYEFPWMDDITIELALDGIRETGIGRGPQTDVLAISLSTTDAIGHRYGPDSKEAHDQFLRLDRLLGRFLDSLFAMRDRGTVAIALTADHGIAPFPELGSNHGRPPGLHVDLTPLRDRTRGALSLRALDTSAFRFEDGLVIVDRGAFKRHGVNADSTISSFLAAALRTPGVMRVDRLQTLRARANDADVIGRRWRHMIPPDLPVEAVVTLAPYNLRGITTYANHGSPHDYDAHVPMILWGDWFRAGRYSVMTRVVDLGPTLAWIADVKPTERLDGRVLNAALK